MLPVKYKQLWNQIVEKRSMFGSALKCAFASLKTFHEMYAQFESLSENKLTEMIAKREKSSGRA